MDNALSTKEELEGKITTLKDLTYSTNNEDVIADINAEIKIYEGDIIKANKDIKDSQNAFNKIAERTTSIQAQREIDLAAAKETRNYLDVQSHVSYLQGRIADYK